MISREVTVKYDGGHYRWATVTLRQGEAVVTEVERVNSHYEQYLGGASGRQITQQTVEKASAQAVFVATERAHGVLAALLALFDEEK